MIMLRDIDLHAPNTRTYTDMCDWNTQIEVGGIGIVCTSMWNRFGNEAGATLVKLEAAAMNADCGRFRQTWTRAASTLFQTIVQGKPYTYEEACECFWFVWG